MGECVYVHTGYAISVVDEAEALESLPLLREWLKRILSRSYSSSRAT